MASATPPAGLRNLVDFMPCGAFLLTGHPGTGFVFGAVNARYAEAVGVAPAELEGKPLGEPLESGLVSFIAETGRRCISLGAAVDGEYQPRHGETPSPVTYRFFPLAQGETPAFILGTVVGEPLLGSMAAPTLAGVSNLLPSPKAVEDFPPVGGWRQDLDSGRISLTPAGEKILGWEADGEFLFEDFLARVHPDDRSLLMHLAGTAEKRGDAFETDFRFNRAGKGERILSVRAQVFRPEGDSQAFLVGTVADVTKMRRAVEAQRAREALLATLVTNAPVILWATDQKGRVLVSEGKGLARQGLKPGEMVGNSIFETYAESPAFLANVTRALDGEAFNAINEVRGVVFERWFNPIRGPGGETVGVVGVTIDITDRIRAENELRSNQALLKTVIDSLPVAVYVKDRESRMLMGNPTLLKNRGLTAEQATTMATEELPFLTPGQKEALLDSDRRVIETEARVDIPEVELNNPQGEARIFNATKVPLRDGEGNVVGLVGITQDITDRKRAEAEIRRSERRFSLLVENATDSIFLNNREGNFVEVNQKACESLGYTREELLTLNIRDIEAGLNPEEIDEITRSFRSGAPPVNILGRQRRKDGSTFPVEVRATVIDAGGGGLILSSVRDITEREEADRKLKESEALLDAVLDAIPSAILVKNREGFYQLTNRTAQQWTGLSDEEIKKRDAHTLGIGTPEQVEQILEQEKVLLEGRETLLRSDMWFQLFGGLNRALRVTKVPLITGEGTISGVVAVFEDITAQKTAEEELVNQRQLLETVFDSLPVWTYVKDLDGNFLMINKAMKEESRDLRLGFDEKGWPDPEQRERILADDREVLEKGETLEFNDRELTLEKGGEPIVFNTFKAPLRDADNRIVGLVGVSQEVTNQKRIEMQLRQAQKMEAVGQLAGGIAHDFNNLLQVIQGYSQRALVAVRTKKERDFEKDLTRVLQASESAAKLTDQLLSFSRRQVLNFAPLDVNSVIQHMAVLLDRVIGEDIDLKFVPGKGAKMVHGDRGMLEQVFMNLVVNARDAMPHGGELKMETEGFLPDQTFCERHAWAGLRAYVRVSVSDTGKGIETEALQHIFEPFFTTKETGKGTGLGLSVVQGIIEQHRGQITVYSEPDLGTTFRIFIPSIEGSGSEVPLPAGNPFTSGGTETVLVAEDDPEVLALAAAGLEELGYQVIQAADGEMACDLFDRHADEVGIVLLDVVMPKKKGRAVFDHIRKTHPALPVLFTTGFSGQSIDSDFLVENGLVVLQKPYSATSLFRAIRQALDAPHPPGQRPA